MRILISTIFIALCALPVGALFWNNIYFSNRIKQDLHESAQSGDVAVVNEEAQRLTMLYPDYQKQIASYVNKVAKPAARIMAVINSSEEQVAPVESNDDHAGLADEFDNMEIGSAQSANN